MDNNSPNLNKILGVKEGEIWKSYSCRRAITGRKKRLGNHVYFF